MGDSEIGGTVLRLPMVHGPGDRLHRLHPILKRIEDGRRTIPLAARTAQWRGPRSYVENVAVAIALAAVNESAAGRIYNVSEPETYTELAWTQTVGRVAGWDGDVVVLPDDLAPAHLKPEGNLRQHWIMDSSRIRTELGYSEAVPLEEALRRTVDWERRNPPAEIDLEIDYAAEDAAVISLRVAARRYSRSRSAPAFAYRAHGELVTLVAAESMDWTNVGFAKMEMVMMAETR